MKRSYVLNVPLTDSEKGKHWICCPSCFTDILLDDGIFEHIKINGVDRNVCICIDCKDLHQEILTNRLEQTIRKYSLEKEIIEDEELEDEKDIS